MRLNKTQKYAIQWLLENGHSVEQIIKELKLPEKTVSNFVEKNTKASDKNAVKTTSGPVTSKDLMIRQTSSKGDHTVAIMTKEASEVNDEFKKKLISKIPSGDLGTGEDVSNCVVFLASDKANYINGETIHVNGGMYMA